jgi:dihydrofolate reductase
MTISLIVAAASNNAIGKDGKMPWHLPADMKHFKNITWGLPVVMGRKTFESLGKLLPGRKNIVITRQPGWNAEGVVKVKNIEDALFVAKETDAKEVMVIGGGEIYNSLLKKPAYLPYPCGGNSRSGHLLSFTSIGGMVPDEPAEP